MAQWNRTDRTLFAKLVYYGPALGGKTTNLQMLHRLSDPEGREKLVAVNTADDRTLFFDLLPLELGRVLGYRVAMKLYTVPGQVRYDATRRIVLAGADAVVFVADSAAGREQDNRQSWENLRLNMRANRLDPGAVPILVQLNKRDLADAAATAAMTSWFGLPPGRIVPAAAKDGFGVIETFLAAARAMLERLVAFAEPATRRTLDAGELSAQLERAFGAFRVPSRFSTQEPRGPATPIVLRSEDLLENAVAGGVELGARLVDASERAARLEREAEALRRLSDALRTTGAAFDRAAVVDAALDAAVAAVGAIGASLLAPDAAGGMAAERSRGRGIDRLLAIQAGRELVARMTEVLGPAVVDDLAAELPAASSRAVGELAALVVLPVDRERRTSLLVALAGPDHRLRESDVRFLGTLAGHLAAGLEKVGIHAELAAHRDRLEETVRARTLALRRAYEDLKAAEATKDRFLSNVSHEMRTPLTAIIGAATFLRDYEGDVASRREMAATVLNAASALEGKVAAVLRVAQLDAGLGATIESVAPAEVLAEALRLAGDPDGVRVGIDPRVTQIRADAPRLARALANLIDNARKFGPEGADIDVHVAPCALALSGGVRPGVALSVLDHGPGLPEADVDRAFHPFEQGGAILSGKPRGVGLGLHEARTIVRRHGGTLVFLNRPGGGSEFRISLPASLAAESERLHA